MNRPSGLTAAGCILFSLASVPDGLARPLPQARPAADLFASTRPDGFTFTPAPGYRGDVPRLEKLLGAPLGARFTEHRDLIAVVRALSKATDRVRVVDYGVTGRPVGIEITAPLAVPLERLNQLLADLGQAPLAEQDYKPVRAA